MRVTKVALHDFRVYHDQLIDFGAGVNVICGGNGQGKTSLLEAIYLLVAGRSFRTPRIKDLIRQETECFHVKADILKQKVPQQLAMMCNGHEKKVIHNKTVCRSIVEMFGLLLGVVMTSDDIALIHGMPQVRRRFLDMHIAQIDPLYVHHLMRYHRALKQRNCLLRKNNLITLETWEQQMAGSAGYIAVQRAAAIAELSNEATLLYQNIAGDKSSMLLEYRWGVLGTKGSADTVEAATRLYSEQWQRHRHKEKEAKCTLIGPHRDEMIFSLNGHPVRYFASEGQQRSCIAALRFAEWGRLKSKTQETPLMMIDDLTTSLDKERRQRLQQQAALLGQVFITTVDAGVVDSFNSTDVSVIEIKKGTQCSRFQQQNFIRL